MPDQFDWWKRALAGEQGLPLSENPESGFYRRKANKTFQAIAVWRDDASKLWMRFDGRPSVAIEPGMREYDAWPFFSASPISHDLYLAVTEQGKPWPDLNEAVTALNNNPPDDESFEALRDAIDDLAREAKKLADAGAAKHQSTADQAGDLANKLGELEKKADARRRVEKKPHEDAGKEVDATWNPIRDAAAAAKTLLKNAVIAPFLRVKDDADRKAREEAASKGAPLPEVPRGVSTTKAGTRGRAVALKSVKKAKINDFAAALKHFAAHPKVADLIQDLANAHVRTMGAPPPGCEIIEEKVAA